MRRVALGSETVALPRAHKEWSQAELAKVGVDLRTVAGRLGHDGEGQPLCACTRLGSPPPTARQRKFSACLPRCAAEATGRISRFLAGAKSSN